MTARIIDGKAVADEIKTALTRDVAAWSETSGRKPCLAAILVGDDAASATYVRMKGKACEKIGMTSETYTLAADTETDELLALITELNSRGDVDGILLQHPTPPQINERAAFDAIDITKDVDGVTSLGFGYLAFDVPTFQCCTPGGMVRLLDHYALPLEGRHAVVIGRSPILGKPMAMMLLARHATVTVCHSRTRNLADVTRQADILVAAVGQPEFVRGDMVKPGAVVLDAGYNPGNVGDVHFDEATEVAGWITPVPGGVGPMTITMLLSNTFDAARARTSAQ